MANANKCEKCGTEMILVETERELEGYGSSSWWNTYCHFSCPNLDCHNKKVVFSPPVPGCYNERDW